MVFFVLNGKNSASGRLLFSILFLVSVLLFVPLFEQFAYGISASPESLEVAQPDGTIIRVHIRGDELFHWYEDLEGYTIVVDGGTYVYASLDDKGQLGPTDVVVGRDEPSSAGLAKRILPSAKTIRSQMPEQMETLRGEGPAGVPPSGTVKNLVVLCMFKDHSAGVHTRPQGDYDILFNQIGGHVSIAPTGSVRDLYLENSYGAMTLDSTVTVWVTLPETEAYYADGNDGGGGNFPRNAQGMVLDALTLVDLLVDFSQFDEDGDGYIDSIDIIHSGYGGETGGGGGDWIWSHRWSLWMLPGGEWTSNEGVKVYAYHTEPALWGTSGTDIVRFAVIAHETGHFFDLPDLYDTDPSLGDGIGSWGMMANSWGFDGSQLHPPHFCAWSKIRLGWATPTVINPGTHTLNQVETNAEIYRIDLEYPSGEYLLIENRQPAGIETVIPQGGLCIFHIDENAGLDEQGYPGQPGWPGNGKHYRVALLQADGNYDMERGNNRGDSGDTYHGGDVSSIGTGTVPNTDAYQGGNIVVTENEISDISASGSSMSFVFTGAVPFPPVAYDIIVAIAVDTPVTVTLEATDDDLPFPPGALSYIITELPSHGSIEDPCAGLITSVPYTLADNGNEVIFTRRAGCEIASSFKFKANDGGAEPEGGDSNIATATVGITVGAQYSYLADFQDGLPEDWSIVDGFSDDKSWRSDNPQNHMSSYLTEPFMIVDSDWALFSDMNEQLITHSIDCSRVRSVTLTFNHYFNYYSRGGDEVGDVDVRVDGGAWQNVAHFEGADNEGAIVLDLSGIADGQADVQIRWHYYNANYDWYWGIDDVEISGTYTLIQALAGDFEPDCDVDFRDYSLLTGAWLSESGAGDWCEKCDISEPADDVINELDLKVISENWLGWAQ